jgi:hypothetical protein
MLRCAWATVVTVVPCGWSLVSAWVLVRHPKLSRVEMVYIFIYIIME